MRYVIKRLLQWVFTIWAVMTISFALIQQIPGGPVAYFRAQLAQAGLDPTTVDLQVGDYTNFDTDDPLYLQYLDYLTNILQGDFGKSIMFNGEPVINLLAESVPWTLFVMSIGILSMFAIGIMLGAIMAYYEGSRFDIGATVSTMTLNSIPYYVAAILLLYALGFILGWFPTRGTHAEDVTIGFNLPFVLSALHHAALPVISIVITGLGGIAVSMRGNSISVLGSDYMRVGHLRGLSSRRIIADYMARNAVLPLYTSLLISIGFMFGGSIILEQVFTYEGIGFIMFKAIQGRDFTLMMGAFILITTAVATGVLIADFTYGRIDPRAKTDRNKEMYIDVSLNPLKWARRLAGALTSAGTTTDISTRRGAADSAYDSESVFDTTADVEGVSKLRLWMADAKGALLSAWDDRRFRWGTSIVAFYLILGTVGVMLVPEPKTYAGPVLQPAFEGSGVFVLGTNHLGQSILGMTVHAIPPMFKMIAAGAVFATSAALMFGLFSGYVGGWVDTVMMTATDIVMTIPGLPLVIVITAIWQPDNPYILGLILAINNWSGLARAVRSEVLTLRDTGHVEAMRAMGISPFTVAHHSLLPNVMPFVSVNFAKAGRRIIFESVGLYFLGVLPFSTFNWGVMLNQAYNNGGLYSLRLAHWLIVPAFAITSLTLGLVLLAQGADRMFNPRLRVRKVSDDGSEAPEDRGGAVTVAD